MIYQRAAIVKTKEEDNSITPQQDTLGSASTASLEVEDVIVDQSTKSGNDQANEK